MWHSLFPKIITDKQFTETNGSDLVGRPGITTSIAAACMWRITFKSTREATLRLWACTILSMLVLRSPSLRRGPWCMAGQVPWFLGVTSLSFQLVLFVQLVFLSLSCLFSACISEDIQSVTQRLFPPSQPTSLRCLGDWVLQRVVR